MKYELADSTEKTKTHVGYTKPNPTHTATPVGNLTLYTPIVELAYATRQAPSKLLPNHTCRMYYGLLNNGTLRHRMILVCPSGRAYRYPWVYPAGHADLDYERFHAAFTTKGFTVHRRRRPKSVRLP